MNLKSVKTQNLSVFLLCHPYFVDKTTDTAQTPHILHGIPEVGGWSIPSSLSVFNQGRHLCRKPSKASSFHSGCNGVGGGGWESKCLLTSASMTGGFCWERQWVGLSHPYLPLPSHTSVGSQLLALLYNSSYLQS